MKYINNALTQAALIFTLLCGFTLSSHAADAARDELAPPPPPPKITTGETIEPEVNIIESDTQRIEEYSVNGKVYAVKITPSSGPAYYLIDTTGDGDLDSRRHDVERNLKVPQWVLFSF